MQPAETAVAATPVTHARTIVDIRQLRKSYGSNEVLKGIDLQVKAGEVLRVVESLADEGMTLLMVTHEMGFARKVSDRVIFMHQGRVHEMGPPAKLFGSPETPELQQFLSSIND